MTPETEERNRLEKVDRTRKADVQRWSDSVDGELYEELLNRYERILVYAGQLQQKIKQQNRLLATNQDLQRENRRLKKLNAIEQSYVRLLEKALESLGVIDGAASESEETSSEDQKEEVNPLAD